MQAMTARGARLRPAARPGVWRARQNRRQAASRARGSCRVCRTGRSTTRARTSVLLGLFGRRQAADETLRVTPTRRHCAAWPQLAARRCRMMLRLTRFASSHQHDELGCWIHDPDARPMCCQALQNGVSNAQFAKSSGRSARPDRRLLLSVPRDDPHRAGGGGRHVARARPVRFLFALRGPHGNGDGFALLPPQAPAGRLRRQARSRHHPVSRRRGEANGSLRQRHRPRRTLRRCGRAAEAARCRRPRLERHRAPSPRDFPPTNEPTTWRLSRGATGRRRLKVGNGEDDFRYQGILHGGGCPFSPRHRVSRAAILLLVSTLRTAPIRIGPISHVVDDCRVDALRSHDCEEFASRLLRSGTTTTRSRVRLRTTARRVAGRGGAADDVARLRRECA